MIEVQLLVPQIHISLMVKNAPHTTNAVSRLAASASGCPKCRFYRNEARPEVSKLGTANLSIKSFLVRSIS